MPLPNSIGSNRGAIALYVKESQPPDSRRPSRSRITATYISRPCHYIITEYRIVDNHYIYCRKYCHLIAEDQVTVIEPLHLQWRKYNHDIYFKNKPLLNSIPQSHGNIRITSAVVIIWSFIWRYSRVVSTVVSTVNPWSKQSIYDVEKYEHILFCSWITKSTKCPFRTHFYITRKGTENISPDVGIPALLIKIFVSIFLYTFLFLIVFYCVFILVLACNWLFRCYQAR
jgi:hypothetical protein